MRLLRDTWFLMIRALIEVVRQPTNEIANIFIPLFFFAVITGAVGGISEVFGIENFRAFQMPVAVLQAVASASGSAGIALTQDIQTGYFDKLRLTTTPRLSLVMGRMAGDAVRGMALTLLVVVIGLLFDTGFASGVAGIVVLVAMAGVFGFAYSGLGAAIALRTGSPQAAQAGFLLFFPLLFLAPTFAPKEFFSPWLEFLATINPVTYVLEAMRSLVIVGWDAAALLKGLVAILGIGVLTLALTLSALRWRSRGA